MNLEAMIQRLAEHDSGKVSNPTPEAAIMRLREFAARDSRDCPFSVGDIVTPRRDGIFNGSGDPQIVVETRLPAHTLLGAPGHPLFGARCDMRVAHIFDDMVVASWVDSTHYEPYTGEGA
jgi:hypothetical protein